MTDNVGLGAIAARLFEGFLRRTHLSAPSSIASVVAEEAAVLGARDVAIYLVDHEQRHLQPVVTPETGQLPAVDIEGTLLGQAFARSTIVEADTATSGDRRLLLPLLDGTERLGVMQMTVPTVDEAIPPEMVVIAERYAHLVAQTIVTKGLYGDAFELVRRTQPMSVATELIRGLLPPLVFATDDLVIAGMLEPAYDAGGDTFDYAVDGATAHLAIFDAMGHGLAAAGDASFAVAAYRGARRRGLGLVDTYVEMDEAIRRQPGDRYVTAILAELRIDAGDFSWLSAGHPPPLLVREGKVVKTLDTEAHTPLGVAFGADRPVVTTEILQRGDVVLLYTDGVPEARLADGEFFTIERLAEFIERQAAAGYTAPETMRRLRNAIVDYQQGHLQDDATALLVEWARGGERALLPQTLS